MTFQLFTKKTLVRIIQFAMITTILFLTFSVSRADAAPVKEAGPVIDLLFSRTLYLTNDQKTAIKAVIANHKTALDAAKTARQNAQSNFVTYLKSGGSDASNIGAYTDSNAASLKALQTEEAAVFAEGYALLTATQKTTLAALTATQAGPPGNNGAQHGPRRR